MLVKLIITYVQNKSPQTFSIDLIIYRMVSVVWVYVIYWLYIENHP